MSNLKKQILIVIICMIAAWMGPIVIIHAESKFFYLLTGLFSAMIFLCMYQLILGMDKMLQLLFKKTNSYYTIGILIGIIPIIILLASGYIYLETMFNVNEGIALLNISIILILILLLTAYNFIQHKHLLRALYETSLLFLLPVAIIFLSFKIISNSESEVIFGNVGILYFLLIGLLVRSK